MNENGKMVLVETVPEMWGKKNHGESEFKYDVLDIL
jgi:hypothetical protein